MPFLDEYQWKSQGQFLTLDDLLKPSRSFISTLDQFAGANAGLDAKQLQDQGNEDSPFWEAVGVLEHTLGGFVKEASFGILDTGAGEPENTAQAIGQAVGGFGGMMVGPFKLARKIVSPVTRAITKGLVAEEEIAGGKLAADLVTRLGTMGTRKLKRVGAYAIQNVATLATAEALRDVTDPAGAPKRAAQGALLGGIFGAAGLITVPNHPILGNILRQFGGRALLAIGGQYPDGLPKAELLKSAPYLANFIFTEAMNSYFLSHGITPHKLLTGNLTPQERADVDMHDKIISTLNEKMKIPMEMFNKPHNDSLRPDEIFLDRSKFVEADVRTRLPEVGRRRLTVAWDEQKELYVPENEHDFYAAILHERGVAHTMGEEYQARIPVVITKPKPGTGPQLQSVAKIAMSILQQPDVSAETFRLMQGAPYFAMDLRYISSRDPVAGLRIIDSGTLKNIKLGPWEVLLHGTGATSGGVKIVPVFNRKAAGVEARKYITEEGRRRLPTIEQRGEMDQLQSEISMMEASAKNAPDLIAPDHLEQIAAKKKDLAILEAQQTLTSMEASAPTKFSIPKELDQAAVEEKGRLLAQKAKLEEQIFPNGELPSPDPATIQAGRKLERVNERLKFIEQELTKQTIDMEDVMNNANHKLRRIRNAPLARLPKAWVSGLERELLDMKLGLTPGKAMDVLYSAIKRVSPDVKGPKVFRLMDLPAVEMMMNTMRASTQETRWDALMWQFNAAHGLTKKPIESILLRDRQAWYDKTFYRNRRIAWNQAEALAKKDGASVMQHLFELSTKGKLLDFRFFAMKMEQNTPIPMYQIYRQLNPAVRQRKSFVKDMTDHIKGFERASMEDQRAVKQYYDAVYDGKDRQYADTFLTTDYQRKYRDAIDGMMKFAAPKVIEARFKRWLWNVYEPRQATGHESGHRALRQQDNPEVNAFLEEGIMPFRLLETARKVGKDSSPDWDAWVAKAIDRNLFTVHEGGYLPTSILTDRDIKLGRHQDAMAIGAFGKGHVSSRDPNAKLSETDSLIAEGIASSFRNQNLNLQLQNYANQIGNLHYVEPKLRAMEDAVNIFREDLEKAKPGGFTRSVTESKGLSMVDMLNIYAARVKGFPLKLDPWQRLLRGAQTGFFRSLAVRPILWLRNMYQPLQTLPHKQFMLDPRFFIDRGYTFKKMPDAAKRWFDLNVNEGDEFRQYYLNEAVELKFANIPGIKQLWDIAEKVGTIYAATDVWNRRLVYSKVWWRSKYYTDAFLKGDVSLDRMENRLGINKMDPQEQRPFREALAAKDSTQAANELATWQTQNSQWTYSRHQRSLSEMTASGEVISNLLTWSKSMGQWVVHAENRMEEGYQRAKTSKGHVYDPSTPKGLAWKQVIDSGVQIGGLALAGIIGNELYERSTNSAGAKYKSFSFGMFGWELGGVSQSIISDLSGSFADGMNSLDGMDSDRNKWAEKFTKDIVDKLALRQMVPFMRQAFAVYEAVSGRSYFSPAFETYTKWATGNPKMATVVNRTIAEGVIHGVFAQDPNKSKEVREWTYNKMVEMERGELTEKNLLLREYYKLQAPRYRYLNSIFQRYAPVEVYSVWENKQKLLRLKDYGFDWSKIDLNRVNKETKRANEEAAGYPFGGSSVKYF